MSQCKKFAPNIFHKTKCSNCFRQKEEHSAEALECNRASRSIARSGYLFVAPDWDFSVPLNRTKRWQRRWFVLYDDGELNYSVDEHPDTVPQGSVDMSKVLEVTGAEQITGHPHSLALTSPDRVTFVKAASREDARWWAELLAVFPRRHKRNATFPGGRASPSLPQLGRSASPQPPRPRHLSVNGPSPRTNFETPPLKEERESPPREETIARPEWLPEPTSVVPIESPPSSERMEYIVTSGSPPTRDKLRCEDKAKARRDWNWRTERFKYIATALTDRSPESSLALPAEGLLHLKKGWLWLRTNNNEWVKRWVVLCGPTLSIYQDQDEQNIPETVVELATVTNYKEVPTESRYGFEIHWSGPALTMSAVTTGIRSNWLQALKKAAPIAARSIEPSDTVDSADSPTTPNTPKCLLSSDEEYKTASEGGRRGSEDWSELPPSPPLSRTSLSKVKDRSRLRPRLPRCQSRQSTLDSTSTEEMDSVKDSESVELHNTINKQSLEISDLQKQLAKATNDLRCMEEEIARLKELQSDAVIREKKAKEQLLIFEHTERELNQRNVQAETKFLREQRSIQKRLLDAEETAKNYEERYNVLSRELLSKQRIVASLQEELSNVNDRLAKSRHENDKLFKRIQELEGKYNKSSSRLNSLTDLTNIDLDIDIDELGLNELKEYCLDLKGRFEKAILEIRAVKKQLRESYEAVDKLEIKNHGLEQNIEIIKQESQAEISLMVARLGHLTAKLNAAEKQLKFKAKTESREKRRSLSLKGRESFSINKEVEDKVTELEAKIVALERGRTRRKFKRDRSSERSSPIDDKALRRLRRKSLDSATSSEQMKLLMRLSSLETKVTNVNASTESLNIISGTNSMSDLTKCIEETGENEVEPSDISIAKRKITECLNQISLLKSRNRRASSPTLDRLTLLEQNLNELNEILSARSSVSDEEIEVIKSSASAAVSQLQSLLIEKLTNLAEKKRLLEENNKLDKTTRLEILAEKVAYENILISRIKEALCSPANGETVCERLVHREIRETVYLMNSLQSKLNGTSQPVMPVCHMGAEHLTKILSNCLIAASQGSEGVKNFLVCSNTPSLKLLQEEQNKLNISLVAYKNTKLPQLAEALAVETITLSSDKFCKHYMLDEDTINEFNRAARQKVNEELIRNEINHILLRAAQMYKKNFDNDNQFFFSFFAAERAALELFSDSVRDALYEEIECSIEELTECYKTSLNKLQRQNWRRRVESERLNCTPKALLNEFADIIAHKALIDARINVLSNTDNDSDFVNSLKFNSLSKWLENDKYWTCLDSHSLVQINQSLEAEFNCMVDKYSRECRNLIGWQPEIEVVLDCLSEIAEKVNDLQKFANVPVEENSMVAEDWDDVCKKCRSLRDQLEEVKYALQTRSPKINDPLEEPRLIHLGTEYLTQVENLRAAYRCALESCKERHQEADIERLQDLCERVLVAIEQWHRRTIQDLREAHAREMEALKMDKEQALAEETQATLAALDAMRKAHEAEVQREVARFKQEFARQQRDDIIDLSEKLSVKCLEAAALEEQLGSATRQLAHAQQHILQLERNPQLSLQN